MPYSVDRRVYFGVNSRAYSGTCSKIHSEL